MNKRYVHKVQLVIVSIAFKFMRSNNSNNNNTSILKISVRVIVCLSDI